MANNHFELPSFAWHNGASLIKMRGITKVFHTTAGDFSVLKGIDVDVFQGEFVSVVGRSGSGKSTLVNMLTGIDHASGGIVQVGDTVLNHMPESKMAVWRGKTLGIVFQFFQLLPMLSVIENIMLPMDFCNMYAPAEREKRAMQLLTRVGLENLAHKLPGAISGGQQQSVAVARALANDPPILIADEPTGNLDSRTAEEVIQLFEELVEQGKTILMVTHDRSLAKRAGRMLLITDGELVDEAVTAAFEDLPHPTLLQLSKLATRIQLKSAAPLPEQGSADELIYLVSKGQLEAVHGYSDGKPSETPSHLGPYQFFAPSSQDGAVVRAAHDGAELLVWNRHEVLPLVGAAFPLAGIQPKASSVRNEPDRKKSPFARWLSQQRRHK